MLNPDLDASSLAATFREDGRIRIVNIFDSDVAERIRACCLNAVPFEYLCNINGKNVAIPADKMANLAASQKADMQAQIMSAAASGVGFFYCGYMMARAQRGRISDDMQFMHSVFDYLNGAEMLSFISTVSGRDDLKSADAQFTRYTPGQFLTRHRDDSEGEMRRLAYVLAFSQNWHPDWGGLLQFFEDSGTPRDAWTPTFNTLSLFDVRHVHSVTYVTPFAREPRVSLTGWFRAKA